MSRKDDAYDLRRIFEEMEIELIRSMRRTLKLHEAEEEREGFRWEQWQRAKLRNLQEYQKRNRGIVGGRSKEIEDMVNQTLQSSFQNGQNIFQKIFSKIGEAFRKKSMFPMDISDRGLKKPELKEQHFFHINDEKLKALQGAVNSDLQKGQTAILRKMDDVYRKTIYRAEMHMAAGAKTLDQAIDMATKEFLEKGINCIEYKGGKRVNIASYAEMALRTASHRATLLGEGKRRDEWGIHTVVVSAHANTCPACEKWQGNVLVDDVFSSGTLEEALEGGYYLLSFAIKSGLCHPNCRHTLSTFFPGVSSVPEIPDGKKAVERYQVEQEQRKLERLVRKQKRIAAGSMEEETVITANKKVRELQEEIRDHLKKYPYLRRAYRREKNYEESTK